MHEQYCKDCKYKFKANSLREYSIKTDGSFPSETNWNSPENEHKWWLCSNPSISQLIHTDGTIYCKKCIDVNTYGDCTYFTSENAVDIIPSSVDIIKEHTEIGVGSECKLEVTITPFSKPAITEEKPLLDENGEPVINEETGLQEYETIIIEPEFINNQDISYKYQWYKDGRKLYNEISNTISVNTETESDSIYYCRVTQTIPNNYDGGNKSFTSDTNAVNIVVTQINAYKNISKVEDYLYETEYEKLDYNYAKEFFKSYYGQTAACSAVRKGSLYGRNYDWYYDDSCSFIVKTSSTDERYSVIGISDSVPSLSKSFVESEKFSHMYRVMPFLLLDGINEKGLVCSINLVPKGDKGITVGTKPKIELTESINQVMLVRYILDKFENAEQAVTYIRDYVSVYAPSSIETHLMVADVNKTFSLEFIDNEIVINELTERPFMTNFYLYGTEYDDNHIKYSSVSNYGSGLERFDYIADNIDSVTDVESMKNLMTSIKFTNAYNRSMENFWYTEYVGDYTNQGFGKITVTSPVEDFEPVVDIAISYYDNRTRFDKKSWQTVHTSVYDIEDKKIYLNCQEGDTVHEITFDN